MRKIILTTALLLFVSVAYAERVLIQPQATFTRPHDTAAYAIGDLVGNSTSAVLVIPMSFTVGAVQQQSVYIRRAIAEVTSSGNVNPSFRLHLFNTTPTVTNGDNGAFVASPAISWFCAIDINMFTTVPFSSANAGIGVPNAGSECATVPPGTVVYGLLEARGAYQPTADSVFTITLEGYYP